MAKLESGLLCLLFMVLLLPVHADRMRPSQSDVASSLQDPKYKIDFHPPESPVLPTSDQETIVMTDRDGKKFRCNLPVPERVKVVNKDGIQPNDNSTSLVADEQSSRKTPEDLLDVLKDKCFLKYEGWWIYELCLKGRLRQFHLHDKKAPISTYGPDMQHGSVVYFFTLVKQPSSMTSHDSRTHRKMIVQEFVLGTFDADATAALHENSPNVTLQKDPRSQSAAQRYHAHVYTNGTICDLTNQPRETEVRFVCSETGRILINSIKEAPTCKYTLVLHAPMLCKHPAFQEERQPWVVIDCNALPSDEVPVEEETTVVETNFGEGSMAPAAALPEKSEVKTPIISLPQNHPFPISEASIETESESKAVEVPSESSEVIEEVTKPAEVSEKTEEPAAPVSGEEKSVEKVEGKSEEKVEEKMEEEGEGKVEELSITGHEREKHPSA